MKTVCSVVTLLLLLASCGRGPARDTTDPQSSRAASSGEAPYEGLDKLATWLRCPGATEGDHVLSCGRIVYVWSRLMPLSAEGRHEVAGAARELGVPFREVDAAILDEWLADGEPRGASAADSLAERLVAAGATVHFPAVLVHRNGEFIGPSIVGYKTTDTYRQMIAERLTWRTPTAGSSDGGGSPSWSFTGLVGSDLREMQDHIVPGQPGAYFRWVPGTRYVAYEVASEVFLLDLDSGARRRAPGWIDFVPSPDGRFFVTPARGRSGLEFYDGAEVLRAAESGRGADVQPVFTDAEMRDQYPSVGFLGAASPEGPVRYRVLTSWFSGVAYRDYEVSGPDNGRGRVWPLGPPTAACSGLKISLPIIRQDGRQIAGRDERTGTTKLFALSEGGECTEVLDLELPTTKVAFDRDGRRVAFAVPPRALRDGGGLYPGVDPGVADRLSGVFVFDAVQRSLSRVPGSEDAFRLTIPEFVRADGVIFLLAGAAEGGSWFRFVPLGG